MDVSVKWSTGFVKPKIENGKQMNISARIKNSLQANDIEVSTNGQAKEIHIPGKHDGRGSSVNGGELLFLSLATCFCNDIYREAGKRKMEIHSVEVCVSGEFGGEGDPASSIVYDVMVVAPGCSQTEIDDLIFFVDKVAEIHNTVRRGVAVRLRPASKEGIHKT